MTGAVVAFTDDVLYSMQAITAHLRMASPRRDFGG
jgi:hypothetical protein